MDGTRHFWEAKFITATFDISPKGLKEVERTLRNEEGVIRFFTTKIDSGPQRFNTRTYQNPYLASVPYMKFKRMSSIPSEYNPSDVNSTA